MKAFKLVYIHIYGLCKPNPSLAYIYMGAIYMFSAFIWLLLCILSFAYMCLGMLQAVVLHHYFPPTRRVALNSIQKNKPKCHGTRWIRSYNMTWTNCVHSLGSYHLHI